MSVTESHKGSMSLDEFYSVLLSVTESAKSCWILLSIVKLYWVLLSFAECHWVWQSLTESHWDSFSFLSLFICLVATLTSTVLKHLFCDCHRHSPRSDTIFVISGTAGVWVKNCTGKGSKSLRICHFSTDFKNRYVIYQDIKRSSNHHHLHQSDIYVNVLMEIYSIEMSQIRRETCVKHAILLTNSNWNSVANSWYLHKATFYNSFMKSV